MTTPDTTKKLADGLRSLRGEILLGGTDLTQRARPLIIDEIIPAVAALQPVDRRKQMTTSAGNTGEVARHHSGVRHRSLVDPDGHELLEVRGTATLDTDDQLTSDLHQITKLCGRILARDFDPAAEAGKLSTLADRICPLSAKGGSWADFPDDSLQSAGEIADLTELPHEAVRKRLERWRKHHSGSGRSDWIEVADRKPKEAQFLYRVGAIRDLFKSAVVSG